MAEEMNKGSVSPSEKQPDAKEQGQFGWRVLLIICGFLVVLGIALVIVFDIRVAAKPTPPPPGQTPSTTPTVTQQKPEPAKIELGAFKVYSAASGQRNVGLQVKPGFELRVIPTEACKYRKYAGAEELHHFTPTEDGPEKAPLIHQRPQGATVTYRLDSGQGRDEVWFVYCLVPPGRKLQVSDEEWYALVVPTLGSGRTLQLD